MTAKLLGTVFVAAALSAVTAVVFTHFTFEAAIGRQAPEPWGYLGRWKLVSAIAFAGSFVASSIFAKNGALTLGWGLGFIFLCDFFAILATVITVLFVVLFRALMTETPSLKNFGLGVLITVVGPFVYSIAGMTIGNFVTKGVGFVMALPALLWLCLCRSRLPGPSA